MSRRVRQPIVPEPGQNLEDARKARVALRARERRAKDPERARAKERVWKANTSRETKQRQGKSWRARNPNYLREWRAKNSELNATHWRKGKDKVRIWLNEYKLDRGCVDCGYKKCPASLQFDHVRGEKGKLLSKIYSMPAARREIANCEVRCANCHYERHYTELMERYASNSVDMSARGYAPARLNPTENFKPLGVRNADIERTAVVPLVTIVSA